MNNSLRCLQELQLWFKSIIAYGPEEISYQNTINGQVTGGVSSLIFLVHVAVLPPALAAFLLGEIAALTILGVLYCLAMGMFLWNWLSNPREETKPELEVTFTARSRREDNNGSINEVLLTDFDQWKETREFFEFKRFGITTIEPKRAYTPQQQENLRSYFAAIGGSNRVKENESPCDLYVQTQSGSKVLARWVYQNQRKDFNDFKKGGFRQITYDQPGEIFRQPTRLIVKVILSLILVVFLLPYIAAALVFQTKWMLAWCFFIGWPALTTVVVFRMWRRSGNAALDRIEDSMFERRVEFGIQKDAWFVGNASSMTVHPWRNVGGFSLSTTLFLISVAGLAYMVPRRILGDETESRKAIMFTLKTHRDATQPADRKGDPTEAVEAIESGNPFQAPRS